MQQVIHVFDADGDSLTLTSNSLPERINYSGFKFLEQSQMIRFSIMRGLEDFLIDLTLSDGNISHNVTKIFNLRVYSRNSPPDFVDENDDAMTLNQLS